MAKRFVVYSIVLGSAVLFTLYGVSHIPRVTHDFGEYYRFSRIILEGRSLAPFYDYEYFNAPGHTYGIDSPGMPNNLPTNALVLIWIAWTDPQSARIVWEFLSIALFIASLGILFSVAEIPPTSLRGLLLAAFCLLYRPTLDNVAWGQMYFLLLFLYALSMHGVRDNRPWFTGIPVALMLVLKGYGILLVLWLVVGRRWKAGLIAMGAAGLLVLGLLPVIDVDSWRAFFTSVLPTLGTTKYDGLPVYQCINSVVLHFTLADNQGLYDSAAGPARTVFIIVQALNVGLVVWILSRLRSGRIPVDIAYSAMLAASVLTAPIALEHTYVFFLPLFISITARTSQLFTYPIKTAVIAVSAVILAAPMNYAWIGQLRWPWDVLAYAKLFSGLAVLHIATSIRWNSVEAVSRSPIARATSEG